MEIIASQLIAAAAPTTEVAATAGSSLPDARATARFAEIMESGPVDAPAAANVPPTAVSAKPVEGTQTLGDRILNGLSGASAEFQQSLKNVHAVLDAGQAVSVQDLLKVQLNLTQVSIQYDLIGKAISRSTQNLDQLVKIQ